MKFHFPKLGETQTPMWNRKHFSWNIYIMPLVLVVMQVECVMQWQVANITQGLHHYENTLEQGTTCCSKVSALSGVYLCTNGAWSAILV